MTSTKLFLSTLAVIGAISFSGCEKKATGGVAAHDPNAPVEVGVVTLKQTPVSHTRELTGRTESFRVAQVRARVNGIILKRHFEEGTDVKEGQLLYEIDPAPYKATLASAEASLARAKANLANAEIQAERFKNLIASNAVSKQQYDDAVAAVGTYTADKASAEAAILAAKIDLDYTQVRSPISGRIGMSEVTEGAYVQAAQANLLATVQQLDPIYLNLPQASKEVISLKKALEKGFLKKGSSDSNTPVNLLYEDNSPYDQVGQLQFSDISVNPTSGSVTLRVLVPNPKLDLLPGMFLRANLIQSVDENGLLAPQQAVSRNYRGKPTIWIVNKEGKAENIIIETGRTYKDQWVVTGGLKVGDQIIMTNLQRIRPGSPVTPVPWEPQKENSSETK
ncbi:MAG: efflux RND transporter periplasmic adaptor subunit [Puniceicoccales bacterium]|jgi:membrane fusion protein (multidrug efflux system)|nr:efflux RND transporter periplasmic adaptor subunit [Puniceicoccales bacterium]